MSLTLIPEIQVKLYLITAVAGLLTWLLAGSPNSKKLALIGTIFATMLNYPVSLLLYLILSAAAAFYSSVVNLFTNSRFAFTLVYFFVLYAVFHFLIRRRRK